MTERYLFLSDPWIDAAKALRDEFDDRIPAPPVAVRVNVVVTDIPHRDDALEGHIDSSDGELIIERYHLDEPELSITLDYATARAAFVTRDPQAVMESFFAGRIYVEGDVSKLMLLQAPPPGDDAVEMYRRLAAFTADDT